VPSCPQCAIEYQVPARFCGQCGTSLPDPEGSPEEDPWLGRVVDRRYRVLSRVGSGGMGLVYKVEHIQLGKIAAMKVLHAGTARDSEAVRRFRTEAQAVSRLSHPNIVQTFDFGQSDGSLYLVMEYVRGDDLAVVIKRDGPMPFHRAAPLFVQICSALTEAHESGVIHRDLKPENIVVVMRREGAAHAKVLDFGLAKLRERTDGAEITSGGQVIGTPYYMSPEQVRAEPLDVRTDIYSLGATLYRVLTGTPPFQAATPVGVLTMHITDPLELPRMRAPGLNLPPAADAIVARAMAKAREDRYASASEIQRDLEAAIAGVHPPATAGDVDTVATARLARRDRTTAHAPTIAFDGAPPAGSAAIEAPSDSDGDGAKSDQRLRKQDFDEFEQSLRRKKLVASLVVPAVLLLTLGAGIWAFGRGREKASYVEREPNNAPNEATLLPLDAPVQGRIGLRLSGGQPDMDYFRVPPGKGPRVVSARLEGIPDVDLVLEMFDSRGAVLGKSDSHGRGGGEWLQPVTTGPAEVYLLVRQFWTQGSDLLENVADPYRLAVHWAPPLADWETEPNDWPDRATPLTMGQAVRGYLGNAGDKDWFSCVPATAGYLSGRVAPPSGVEIAIVIERASVSPATETARQNEKTGEIRIAVKAGDRWLIGLSRKRLRESDPKAEPLAGLDDPYELKVDLRSAP
jgi:eukaryotic-like serine/threonine-protein kinase